MMTLECKSRKAYPSLEAETEALLPYAFLECILDKVELLLHCTLFGFHATAK